MCGVTIFTSECGLIRIASALLQLNLHTVYLVHVLRMRRVVRHLLDVCPKLNARGRMVTVRARDKGIDFIPLFFAILN